MSSDHGRKPIQEAIQEAIRAQAAGLADGQAAGRHRDPAAVAAAEAQRARRHHHPRHRGLLQGAAEGHQGRGDPRRRRAFLRRPRSRRTDRARRRRRRRSTRACGTACSTQIQFGKVPVVAVLHGAVVGGGLELAAACHLRVAERSAYYALPEGSRGIFVGGGGSVRLPRLIGVSRMMDLMLTGRTYGAEEGQTLRPVARTWSTTAQGLAKGIELAERVAEQRAADELRHHARAAAHRRERSGERAVRRIADGGDRLRAATKPRRG